MRTRSALVHKAFSTGQVRDDGYSGTGGRYQTEKALREARLEQLSFQHTGKPLGPERPGGGSGNDHNQRRRGDRKAAHALVVKALADLGEATTEQVRQWLFANGLNRNLDTIRHDLAQLVRDGKAQRLRVVIQGSRRTWAWGPGERQEQET